MFRSNWGGILPSNLSDAIVQVASAQEFAAHVKSAGGSCHVHVYEGAGHAFLSTPSSKALSHRCNRGTKAHVNMWHLSYCSRVLTLEA